MVKLEVNNIEAKVNSTQNAISSVVISFMASLLLQIVLFNSSNKLYQTNGELAAVEDDPNKHCLPEVERESYKEWDQVFIEFF